MSSSIARHHAEWLSLIEISGPFLSISVLSDALPQGLDARDSDIAAELRAAYDEWADNQFGLNPEPAMHNAWVNYILQTTLEMPDRVIARGQSIPDILKFFSPEHGETVRPDIVIHNPDKPHEPRMLVMIYPSGQGLEKSVKDKRWTASPAQRMQELLHITDVRIGMITNGDQWMLVNAKRGETSGFISWDADLWTQEPLTLRSFRTLFNAHRFFAVPDDMTLAAWLDNSANDQAEVTDQLGYQVRRAVEIIVQTIDRIDADRGRELLQGVSEDELYEAALTVMMRLVFLMSAEERDLMPMDADIYAQNYAVSTLRGQLREVADQNGEEILERRQDAWSRVLATFRTVHGGVNHEDLNLPAYGGSLFDPDRFPFLEGRAKDTQWLTTAAEPLAIDNRTVLHLLEALQMLQMRIGGQTELRRLSFRSLNIEQIGHVYEGLLDHKATRAETVILGLKGTKDKEPEIALDDLWEQATRDTDGNFDDLAEYVREQSGRSKNAILNDIKDEEISGRRAERLFMACNGDEELYDRVKPFAHLIRDDDYGYPAVFPVGSVYVTSGTTRRATGTHYTPKSLTEPIVQHTLEPIVYIGPAEGHAREDWQLKPPTELLDLKICDMAMGSGAFLVQVVRYMSERLVEAWESTMDAYPNVPHFTVEGLPPTDRAAEILIPDDPDERLVLARRLIADRCIYGVDKNPLAVEMAKLSLWLITLEKNRAFTFLDHALKCGDSLVGVDLDQLRFWDLHPDDKQQEMFIGRMLQPIIERAIELRQRLESFTVKDIRDQQEKQRLYNKVEATTAVLKTAGDHLIAEAMGVADSSILSDVVTLFKMLEDAGDDWLTVLQENSLRHADRLDLTPFHWQLEYPEVFQRGGFSAFVGNPPFIGGTRISTLFGSHYLNILRLLYPSFGDRADICAIFFVKSFKSLSRRGCVGFIATNTIAQSDTRDTGIALIVANGADIYRANPSQPWAGQAAVVVSVVIFRSGDFLGQKYLGNETVPLISTYLTDMPDLGDPYELEYNKNFSYMGVYVRGSGFVLDPEEAEHLLKQSPQNSEVVLPYINGQNLNSNPDQSANRWVINFWDMDLNEAEQYEEPMAIVREKVFPERTDTPAKQKEYDGKWWKFWRARIDLFDAISDKTRIIGRTRVTQTHAPAFLPTDIIYSDAITILAYDDAGHYCALQSSLHEYWAWQYGSTLKQDLRYSPTDCFNTFPFPADVDSIEDIGERYHETRRGIMLARQQGLTATYNRFHDIDETADDINTLRILHMDVDNAVASAYGWDDIDLGHDFHDTAQGIRFTISESARREVLTRLLKLNHERFAEECRQGLHTTKKGKKACQEFFAEHPHLKGQSSASTPTISSKSSNKKSSGLGIRPFGEDNEDDNPKQKKLF